MTEYRCGAARLLSERGRDRERGTLKRRQGSTIILHHEKAITATALGSSATVQLFTVQGLVSHCDPNAYVEFPSDESRNDSSLTLELL
jgi:hypothetical protein